MTIQEKLKAAGLRLNLLYQDEKGKWHCSLVKDYPEVEGDSLEEVIDYAISRVQGPVDKIPIDSGGVGRL